MADRYEYEEAKLLSLDETLGIDPEKSREAGEELAGFYDAEDLLEDQRAAAEMLAETDAHLEEYVRNYEKDKERESVEMIYTLKISILHSMAKRFHPLSKYGKEQLFAAAACRREFEALAGPLVTMITKNNVDLFRTVLSADLCEDICFGRRAALGALRTRKGTVYGVGAVAYHIDTEPVFGRQILRIDWLFVNKKFRERSIADFLLGELMAQAAKAGVAYMSAEFAENTKEKEILAYILGAWKFELDAELSPDAVIRLGDVTEEKKIAALNKEAVSLADFNETERERFIRHTLGGFRYEGYLKEVPGEYTDKDLSFYAGSKSEACALLLAHRSASGMMRVEYLASAPEKEKYLPALLCAFLESAKSAGDADTKVLIPVEAEEIGLLLDKLCSRQLGQYLLSGMLNPPAAGLDFDAEDIEQLLAATE